MMQMQGGRDRRLWSGSMRRLGCFLLLLSMATGFLVWHWPKQWKGDAARETELASVGALFANGRIEQALARLEEPPLRESAEALFARAAILVYTPYGPK